MNLDRFLASLTEATPPAGLSDAATAVWFGLNGDWDRAHEIVQGHEGEADPDWVHAWLHRVEGDASNAAYWYRRAGQEMASGSTTDEGRAIAASLLAKG